MDRRKLAQKAQEWFQKYRFPAIILLAGLLLMLLPGGSGEKNDEEPLAEPLPIPEQGDFEAELAEILSQMEGAGRVSVFLSTAAGEETVYQTDEDISQGDLRRTTVVISGSGREESGLVRQIYPARYRGAVILCQGADSASVRLSITQAVANATGLGADQISVLKMK